MYLRIILAFEYDFDPTDEKQCRMAAAYLLERDNLWRKSRPAINKRERTEVLSLWTSLGLKFVAMMQLIERMFAVAVGGASVNIRKITFGENPGQL